MLLGELSKSSDFLKFLYPKSNQEKFKRLHIDCVRDLLMHLPVRHIDRQNIQKIPPYQGEKKVMVNTRVCILDHKYIRIRYNSVLKIKVLDTDSSNIAYLLCYGRGFLSNVLTVGINIYLYAQLTWNYREWQSSQFDYVVYDSTKDEAIEKKFFNYHPIYPLTKGLAQQTVHNTMKRSLNYYSLHIDDELPDYIREELGLYHKGNALAILHFPSSSEEYKLALRTLKVEELFHFHCLLQIKKHKAIQEKKINLPIEMQWDLNSWKKSEEKILNNLPFSLTDEQILALNEMKEDFSSSTVMYRLLQGDVGTGKTLTACIAAFLIIEKGFQVAFMAPNEILALQHQQAISKYFQPLGIQSVFLSSKTKNKAMILQSIQTGEAKLIIGTHCLFSEKVKFHKLGLSIIDEQHKFGVKQRGHLLGKGSFVHTLLMSATPIPRTLSTALSGHLKISSLYHRPYVSQQIKTYISTFSKEKEDKLFQFIKKNLKKKYQTFIVLPFIEDSKKKNMSHIRSLKQMFPIIQKKLHPYSCALLHSRVSGDKEKIMKDFQKNKINVLVSTSMIEVGVDIPNANIIVVYHAERFGLASLHQLRGRVGRSHLPSHAIFMAHHFSPLGKKRLKILKDNYNGFDLAQKDLFLRGPGELIGLKQSGFYPFIFANLEQDTQIFKQCQQYATTIFSSDPHLEKYPTLARLWKDCPPFTEDLLFA